ncbi:MAG TPA: 2-nitropropane dioxygenase [Thermoanaerobaculia bacterium]|nr:2-nitropropane dioxygenase [Thermoanaerobaculia bacterium]
MAENFEVHCPCCEALLVVDRLSGEVLLHKVKERTISGSLESMVSNLDKQRDEAAKRFDKQMESQKDRARLLEEKFREALQRAEKSDEKPFNPMDLD